MRNSLGHFCAVLVLTACMALAAGRPAAPSAPTPKAGPGGSWTGGRWPTTPRSSRMPWPPAAGLMAVVKADAYGHGAVPVARCLQKAGVNAFAVACLAEGIRAAESRHPGDNSDSGLHPAGGGAPAAPLAADPDGGRRGPRPGPEPRAGGRVRVHLALDTGMRRLGVPAEDHERHRPACTGSGI